jgi:hypothetical protein
MLFYGVLDLLTCQVLEFFVSRDGAERFVAECLVDEPDWGDALAVRSSSSIHPRTEGARGAASCGVG